MAQVMAKPQVALLLPCKGSILQGKVPRPALLGPVARKGPRRKSNPNPGGHSCRWGGATGSSAGAKLSRRDVLRASGVAMASMSLPLSCFSSAAQAAAADASGVSAQGGDLLVVGAGVLGTLVGQQWLERFPGSQVYGQTRTDTRHGELQALGIQPVTSPPTAEGAPDKRKLFPFVIFCAPPSGSPDYAGAVSSAAESWDGQGVFLYTSSSAMYDVNDGGSCRDDDPACPSVLLGQSPRLDTLVGAEAAAFAAKGSVVRLAGLYVTCTFPCVFRRVKHTKERGAHTFWLRKGTVDSRPDHFLNLIHYEDAASLCVAILTSGIQGQLFMGCDNHPVSRAELMDITVKSGKFEGSFQGFTGADGSLGKRMDNSKTRATVGWSPKYSTFEEFLSIAD